MPAIAPTGAPTPQLLERLLRRDWIAPIGRSNKALRRTPRIVT